MQLLKMCRVLKNVYWTGIIVVTVLASLDLKAATITVTSVSALQTAITNSSPGDELVLINGTYLNNTLTISKNNITVRAETVGGVFLNGKNTIIIAGNNNTFSGFQFTAGDIGLGYIIDVSGNRNILTNLNFSGYFAQKYIAIKGGTQYNEISYCNIEKKPLKAEIGCTIQISTSPTVPGYHKIRYCSFQNFEGVGGDNGNEPVRIGLGAEALNASRTIVEYCYFNNTGLGDSESISVKSRENTIRYCTFTNQQDAMLVFRYGDNNVAYSNFFINAGGIRVKEANNIYCYNNYFENSGVGSSADAVTYVYISPNLNNINFLHNTFVNCGNIDLGGKGPTNNTWANNIFKKPTGNIFKNDNLAVSWAGNIYTGTLGIPISTGMINTDPKLEKNADGYQGLSSSSPAIDAASANYPSILHITDIDDDPSIAMDISGQMRPSTVTLKDVGCDEFTTGVITNRPLTLSDVGPSFLRKSIILSVSQNTQSDSDILLFPNPVGNQLSARGTALLNEAMIATFYSINGQVMQTVTGLQDSQSGDFLFDTSGLSNGLYLARFTSKNTVTTRKVVILR